MSYVWEYISEEDKQRIGFAELIRPWWRSEPNYWAVDRETGNFLMDVTPRNEDTRNQMNYLFGWRGAVLSIDTSYKQIEQVTPFEVTYLLTARQNISLPVDMEAARATMVEELTQAITCKLTMNGQFKHKVLLANI